MNKLIFSHPTGNANVRSALKAFNDANLLYRFFTTIASFPGSLAYKAAIGPLKELRRRSYDSALQAYTSQRPFREAGRMASMRLSLKGLIRNESGYFSIDQVYRDLDNHVASKLVKFRDKIDALYCYEDGALHSFQKAHSIGLKCLYDLPIGYWRRSQSILKEAKAHRPEWASTLGGLNISVEKLHRKDEELQLADMILVASSFTAQTLEDYPGSLAPVKVVPYGFPPVFKDREYMGKDKKLKVLFVGGLSQRKGIAYLFEAVDKLQDYISLTVVGKRPNSECAVLDKNLAKHHWIDSLSHREILGLMREHDLFVFPSLFEGFGLVITEAMSQGTPVITTRNTCGADFIMDGQNGWLADTASTDSLVQKLEFCISNRDAVQEVGRNAMATAHSRPWKVYEKELVAAVGAS